MYTQRYTYLKYINIHKIALHISNKRDDSNTLDISSDEQSQMSTIINDLVKPTTMSKEKVQSIIEEKLNVTPSVSPSASTKSEESNQIKIEIKDRDKS